MGDSAYPSQYPNASESATPLSLDSPRGINARVTHYPIGSGRIAKPTFSSYNILRSQGQLTPIPFIHSVCRSRTYLSVNVLKMYYPSATEATINELAGIGPLSLPSTCATSPVWPVLRSGSVYHPSRSSPEGVSHHYLRVTRFWRNSIPSRKDLFQPSRGCPSLPIVMIELPGNYESNVEFVPRLPSCVIRLSGCRILMDAAPAAASQDL